MSSLKKTKTKQQTLSENLTILYDDHIKSRVHLGYNIQTLVHLKLCM